MSNNQPLVSIIVRTKNEERWIHSCLTAIFSQTYKNFEVILVDNQSTDQTVEKAKSFPIHEIVVIEDFIPGLAINMGIRKSSGSLLCCISAHCIPTNENWLENLVRNFDSSEVAGVYGRQEPMSFTPDTDKRDLMIIFGLDKKIQRKDCFFHNANSMFRRSVWEKHPFDEKATNIEDRIWAREVIKSGYILIYEPEASVYHYHGIHQSQDKNRCRNVVKIIEELEYKDGKSFQGFNILENKVVAIIPVKGKSQKVGNKTLLEITINQLKQSKYINDIIVSTDDEETAELARKNGALCPFIRDDFYSKDYIDLEQVYKYTLEKLESQSMFYDVIVCVEETFPFRGEGIVDQLLEKFSQEGVDSVIAVRPEHSPAWTVNEGEFKEVGQLHFSPRKFKDPLYVAEKGIGCVTLPVYLREGRLLGPSIGILPITNSMALIEVRDEQTIDFASRYF